MSGNAASGASGGPHQEDVAGRAQYQTSNGQVSDTWLPTRRWQTGHDLCGRSSLSYE